MEMWLGNSAETDVLKIKKIKNGNVGGLQRRDGCTKNK